MMNLYLENLGAEDALQSLVSFSQDVGVSVAFFLTLCLSLFLM